MLQQRIEKKTFANGLTVLVEPMADVQSAAFSLMVPAGSVHDAPGCEGSASLMCDWMMRGAGDLDNRALTTALDNLGLHHSEGAGVSHLSFGGATVSENIPAALRIFADVVRRPQFPEDEFEGTRLGVEQSLRAIEDEPRQKVMIELRRRCYPTPWGLPTEGSLESVLDAKPQAAREHYQRCVRPGDTILGVAGQVSAAEIFDLAEEAFGDWQTKPVPTVITGAQGVRRDHILFESTQTHIGVAYDSVPYSDDEYYDAWAAVGILSGGSSSRLFTEVRERRGLCYSVYATLHGLRDHGRVLCYAGTTAERAQETLDVMLQEIRRLSQGMESDELERCKARAKSSLIMQQESSSARASSIARNWYHLQRVMTLSEVRAKIEGITVEKILDHLHRHEARDFTILTIGPQPLEVNLGVS